MSKEMIEFNWDKIVPEICNRYAAGESMEAIFKGDDTPGWPVFYYEVVSPSTGNSEYRDMWEKAGYGKAEMIDSDFDEIAKLAKEGVRNKDINPNALRPWLEARKVQRGQLNPKFNERQVKHTIEPGESMREIMTKARQRIEGPYKNRQDRQRQFQENAGIIDVTPEPDETPAIAGPAEIGE